jgi:hypothetical protein
MKGKYKRKRERKRMSSGNPIQPAENPASPKSTTSNKNPESTKNVPLSSQVKPTPEHKNQSCHCKPNDIPTWKIVLECTAIAVGIAVAIIYFFQWRAMDATMKIDQRAWISLNSITNVGKFAVGEPFGVSVSVKNIGKTPARDTYSSVIIEPRENGQPPRFERDTSDAVSTGVMIPNADYYGTPILTTCHLEGRSGERAGPDFTCPLTQHEYDTIEDESYYLYLHGRVDYKDVFSHKHWFTYCYFMMKSGTWALCPGGHGADTDNE